jgi:hypothetical protein
MSDLSTNLDLTNKGNQMTNYKFELSNGFVMEFDAEADRATRYIDALYQGHISRLWIDEVEYQK